MLKALKIRLYPNKEQIFYMNKLLGSNRFVYNKCLNYKIDSYEKDKTNINLSDLGHFFFSNLRKEYEWLTEHNTKVLMQSILDMLVAYKNFFKYNRGFPNFKCKSNEQKCRFPREAISRINDFSTGKINLNTQLKDLKFKTSDKYTNYLNKNKDKIKSATLIKTKTNKYFLSILIDGYLLKTVKKPINESVGLDLGIKNFVVTSNGDTFKNIKIKRNNDKKIKKLHKNLSKKKLKSKNREKARVKLARFYEKLTNIKENYLHEVSNKIIDDNQVISIEDLNVSGMMKNHKLAKSIQELSLFRFRSILAYKALWYDRDLIVVDRFYPSSKLCNNCGYKKDDLTLNDRTWICPKCGINYERDFNAANNINKEGYRLYKINRDSLARIEAFGESTIVDLMN